jgi:hypothetical protein
MVIRQPFQVDHRTPHGQAGVKYPEVTTIEQPVAGHLLPLELEVIALAHKQI